MQGVPVESAQHLAREAMMRINSICGPALQTRHLLAPVLRTCLSSPSSVPHTYATCPSQTVHGGTTCPICICPQCGS